MSDPDGGVHLTKMSLYLYLQSNMRGFICHAISLHPLSIPSIPRQKHMSKYQNVDRYKHVCMKIYRVM